jgi:hypothetical protein
MTISFSARLGAMGISPLAVAKSFENQPAGAHCLPTWVRRLTNKTYTDWSQKWEDAHVDIPG